MAAGQEWSHTVEPPPSLLLIDDLESNNKTRRRPNYSSEGNWRKYMLALTAGEVGVGERKWVWERGKGVWP